MSRRFAVVVAAVLAGCGPGTAEIGNVSDESGAISRALNPRAAALDGSPFGVNSHGGPADMLETFASINLRWHRVDAEWSTIERVEGQYDWSLQDDIVASQE